MKIYFISPIDYVTPDLFSSFTKTFKEQGHVITKDINEADCVFIDLHTRIGKYDRNKVDVVLQRNLPIVFFDAWDYGAMAKDTWPGVNVDQIHDLIVFSDNKKIFFIRKMDKTLTYPKYCYPYELLMYQDHIFEPVTKEELFNRPNDICFIGNTSPTRVNVTTGLKDHFKCDFVLGQEKIPHDEWLDRHRQSKLFLEACGGGFGSERPYQLITIAPMLKVNNNQLIVNDFRDSIDCIKVNEMPTSFDIEDLQLILSEPGMLYSIYLNGIERMKKYFNAEVRALYVLETLKENGIY